MNYKKLLILFLISILSSTSCATETAGFDEICKIYVEAANSSMTSSVEEFSKYIFENIKNRVNDPDALSVHDAIFGANPDQRYALMKESAEYALKRPWDCQAMKKIMGKNSEKGD